MTDSLHTISNSSTNSSDYEKITIIDKDNNKIVSEQYIPVRRISNVPLTAEEKFNLEVLENDMKRSMKEEIIKLNGGHYGFVFKGKIYKLDEGNS